MDKHPTEVRMGNKDSMSDKLRDASALSSFSPVRANFWRTSACMPSRSFKVRKAALLGQESLFTNTLADPPHFLNGSFCHDLSGHMFGSTSTLSACVSDLDCIRRNEDCPPVKRKGTKEQPLELLNGDCCQLQNDWVEQAELKAKLADHRTTVEPNGKCDCEKVKMESTTNFQPTTRASLSKAHEHSEQTTTFEVYTKPTTSVPVEQVLMHGQDQDTIVDGKEVLKATVLLGDVRIEETKVMKSVDTALEEKSQMVIGAEGCDDSNNDKECYLEPSEFQEDGGEMEGELCCIPDDVSDSSPLDVGDVKSPDNANDKTQGANSTINSATAKELDSPLLRETPALVPSLFTNIRPTIYFGTSDERVELLPRSTRKLLKWKKSPVTPIIVKQAMTRSHFTITSDARQWLLCWGKHMHSPAFRFLLKHQKLNHFPGTFQIGRKDLLWRNLARLRKLFGRQEFGFFPQSFVLPFDLRQLQRVWDQGVGRRRWIAKPPAGARGNGIKVLHKWNQLPKSRPLVVQRYLHKPFLIDGCKFDLRVYVYVTSYNPLRIYIFNDGLVRFASCRYSPSTKNLGNRFMHLTNYSVNRHNSAYEVNLDRNACSGHKWALKALWNYLNEQAVDTTSLWEQIKDIVMKTIMVSEAVVNTHMEQFVQHQSSCHELFGFDIMLDEKLKPWLLEVNISPSLHSSSTLDINVKGQLIKDLLNLAGIQLPQRKEQQPCSLTENEKSKQSYYLSAYLSKQAVPSLLDALTPDDVWTLVQAEDELSRCGQFERVFPTMSTVHYLRFLEVPRYYNFLLYQWEVLHHAARHKGIAFLNNLCKQQFHLDRSDHHHWDVPDDQASLQNGVESAKLLCETNEEVPQLQAVSS
uniref:tubulin monoglutamylase TTLL4-like isoform X2 n=1 Tax=Myxine glutinosa TaxID=7769 RepID=UPI00358E9F74